MISNSLQGIRMSNIDNISNKPIFSQLSDGDSPTLTKLIDKLKLNEIRLEHDETQKILWCKLHQEGRPCFTFDLGNELETLQIFLENNLNDYSDSVRYFIFGSDTPEVFNLGGDLELFVNNIRENNIKMMKRYAHKSINILERNLNSFNSDIITIGLVQGNALGGGFEFALSFDILVAEKNTRFGLPEILFNLFPGMGAYSFLIRKIGRKATEEMILGGNIYTGQQLYDLGVVDILAEDGEGTQCVSDYIQDNQKRFNAEKSIYDVRKKIHPITKSELMEITNLWSEMAMKLNDDDLRKMEKLVKAQKRLARKNSNDMIETISH